MSDIPNMGKSIAYGTIKTGDHYAVVNLSDSYWRELVYGYLACFSFVDDQAGNVIEALESSKYADNTIVVLWSDHGQHLGEKKHWRKQALWEESTKVPLYFKVPGQKINGLKSKRVVSLLDIYPTLVELCDLPANKKLQGENLVPLINNPELEQERFVLSTWYYKNHAVRSDNWRYIHYRDGSEELYNHENDPGEHINLASDSQFADVIAAHKKWLPEKDALPATTTEWNGDKLDTRIENWIKNDSIPKWLQ
jgi:arylsulfatase A-like enzyme